MPSITLKYVDTASLTYQQTFSALSVKGFRAGDGHVVVPGVYVGLLNGSIRKKQAGFRRVFTLDLGVITTAATLEFLGGFLASETQYLTFTYDSTTETDLRVVDRHEEYEAGWINNIEIGRQILLRLEEANSRTAYPSGSPTPVNSDLDMYFKKKVAVTGTPGSPQTFTLGASGSGTVITTDEDGDAFPAVSAATYIWRIEISSLYQEAPVYITTAPTLDGNNYPTFALSSASLGSASSDGAYYADFTLWLKLR